MVELSQKWISGKALTKTKVSSIMADDFFGILPIGVKDLTGKRSGKLTAMRYLEPFRGKSSKIEGHLWECRCDCGGVKSVKSGHINQQYVKSCGCLKYSHPEGYVSRPRIKDHPLYDVWVAMRNRCFNERNKDFKFYGGRGIKVEEPWKSSFWDFYEDVIGLWAPGLSIDRIEGSGNYCKSNCRFGTASTQANNTRRNIFVTLNGRKLTVMQWSREIGVSRCRIMGRISKGLSPEMVLLRD